MLGACETEGSAWDNPPTMKIWVNPIRNISNLDTTVIGDCSARNIYVAFKQRRRLPVSHS